MNAKKVIASYFDQFYNAYRDKDLSNKNILLKHAQEINCTRLGYGRGDNGHGNTAEGLIVRFKPLDKLIESISAISLAIDLPLFIHGFNQDGLSDMLTNILHKQLHDFTLSQLKLLNKAPNDTRSFWSWDIESSNWMKWDSQPAYVTDRGKLLLVPKEIVRFRYLCSTEQYLRKVIINRIIEDRSYYDHKGRRQGPSIKEIKKEIYNGRPSWMRDFVIPYSSEYPDALGEYHRSIPGLYVKHTMSDEDLDRRIYN